MSEDKKEGKVKCDITIKLVITLSKVFAYLAFTGSTIAAIYLKDSSIFITGLTVSAGLLGLKSYLGDKNEGKKIDADSK